MSRSTIFIRSTSAGLLGALALSLTAGCAGSNSARRDELVAQPMNLDNERLALGHQVFETYCNQCHPGGAAGVGPALNDKKFVPGFLIKFQVRHGMGAMPKFSARRISDADLDALVSYLKALRDNRQ
jgi:mono/diheme cytochrome c family protein